MQGYLRPYIPELTIRDYNTYMQYARGVRRQMYKDYGLFSCRLLRHDTVVLALLSDSLAGREATCRTERRPGRLLKKEPVMCQTHGIHLAAQMEIILAWHSVMDTPKAKMTPRKAVQKLLFRIFLRRAYCTAVLRSTAFVRLLCQERAQEEAQILSRGHSYVVASEPMSNVFAAIYAVAAPDDSDTRKIVRYIGNCVGRIFYLLETAYSHDRDRQQNFYNVFLENGLSQSAALENARRQCIAEVENLAHAYNMLDVKLNRSLLDNIMILSLHHTVDSAGKESDKTKWEIP